MTHPNIRHATAADVDPTAELIAAAFHDLDVSAWLVPDPTERTQVLTAAFRILVDHALTHGEIHLIDNSDSNSDNSGGTADHGDLIAAAVWFPYIDGPTPPPEDYDRRLAAACGEATGRFRVLDDLFDDTHPYDIPHHYLAYLATRPGWQSRGLGETLLRRHHQLIDRDGMSAFLHASCARTRDFYQRHSYKPLDSPFHLPDGPPMWPMVREPNPYH